MDKKRLSYLLKSYATTQLNEAERQELSNWILNDPASSLFQEQLAALMGEQLPADVSNDDHWNNMVADITSIDKQDLTKETTIHRSLSMERSIWKIGWRWAAAIFILVLAGGGYYILEGQFSTKKKAHQVAENKTTTGHVGDLLPGKEGAILTLDDGTEVVLEHTTNNKLENQDGSIAILENGKLVYTQLPKSANKESFNTIKTPRGRAFQITLPDSTRVWLNAASSIRYPTKFSDNLRKVDITGEIYFEVAKNPTAPFKVLINGNESDAIEVLGTSFNVNGYTDEKGITTTLIEGAVQVTKGQQKFLLKPGQQANVNGAVKITNHADVQKALAWKRGFFDFRNVPLEKVLRQLARWYDLDVVYEGAIPAILFGGEMSRNVKMSSMLMALKEAKVQYRLEGENKLIILP